MSRAAAIPSGTITLLFTDVEGSTRLWEAEPEPMAQALRRHDEMLRAAIGQAGGFVFKTVGDAFCAAFATPQAALGAVLAAQRALAAERWPTSRPIRVRMGLHTGVCEERDNDYFGPVVNRTARLEAVAHGGQVLISGATAELLSETLPEGVTLRDLGLHRLKDLGRAERVFQLEAEFLAPDFPPLASLDNPELPNNLPGQLSAFVGREREVREVRKLVGSSRLVTLTGAGGCGKTRLALQAAAELLDDGQGRRVVRRPRPADRGRADPGRGRRRARAGRSWRAAAAGVADGIAARAGHAHPAGQLRARDRRRRQALRPPGPRLPPAAHPGYLAGAAGPRRRARVPRAVAVAAAGRGRGRGRDRRVRRRPALRGPGAGATTPGFGLDEDTAPLVASVCRRLDGIPLALELAAARLSSMSIQQVSQRLDQRFRLLTGGSRNAMPRQQTLQATVDWSFGLLHEPERETLRRLSVFAGGFELEAAEAICADGSVDAFDVMDLLGSLVGKSLVVADRTPGSVRYRLLDTIRQYAAQELLRSGGEAEVVAARDRHAGYFLGLAQEAAPALSGLGQGDWLRRLDPEWENLRAAAAHLADQGRTDDVLRLGVWLQWFAMGKGHTDVLTWLRSGVDPAAPRPDPLHAEALVAVGWLTGMLLRLDADARAFAGQCAERALAMARELGDRRLEARALLVMGSVAYFHGDMARLRRFGRDGVAIARELGDVHLQGELLACLTIGGT